MKTLNFGLTLQHIIRRIFLSMRPVKTILSSFPAKPGLRLVIHIHHTTVRCNMYLRLALIESYLLCEHKLNREIGIELCLQSQGFSELRDYPQQNGCRKPLAFHSIYFL